MGTNTYIGSMQGMVVLLIVALFTACTGGGQANVTSDLAPNRMVVQPSSLPLTEQLQRVCVSLGNQLAPALPANSCFAVLPLCDPDGGVRGVGEVLARGIEHDLLKRGLRGVDRRNIDKLLREIVFQEVFSADSATMRRARNILKAGVLIVGQTVHAGQEMLVEARAIDVSSGRIIAASGNEALASSALGQLLWYVRRPRSAKATGSLPPLALRYEFLSMDPYRERIILTDGSTVMSGQKFKVRVEANSDCYLYVLLYDSEGQANVLFPHESVSVPNEAKGGVTYEIPDGTKWYWFDDKPGLETFYIVGSYTPLENLKDILAKMQTAGQERVALSKAARKEIDSVMVKGMAPATSSNYRPKGFTIFVRGVGGVVDAGKEINQPYFHQIDSVVQGHATAVKKIVMKHR